MHLIRTNLRSVKKGLLIGAPSSCNCCRAFPISSQPIGGERIDERIDLTRVICADASYQMSRQVAKKKKNKIKMVRLYGNAWLIDRRLFPCSWSDDPQSCCIQPRRNCCNAIWRRGHSTETNYSIMSSRSASEPAEWLLAVAKAGADDQRLFMAQTQFTAKKGEAPAQYADPADQDAQSLLLRRYTVAGSSL